jgi:hypothetical protein
MPGSAAEWDALRTPTPLSERRVPRFVEHTPNIKFGDAPEKTEGALYDDAPPSTAPKSDEVNKPDHYNTGAVECIDAIKASMSAEEFKGYLKGNTIKYLWRYNYKGKPKQDLQKAQWYLNKLIEEVQ